VTYSGTINYLNKFGQKSKSYKMWDPVSELYAEAIKYFKNLKPTKSYVSGVNANRDDFPVFTTGTIRPPTPSTRRRARSPARRTTSSASVTPTATTTATCRAPLGYPADVDSNMGSLKTAKAWTDEVGALEGIPGLSARRSTTAATTSRASPTTPTQRHPHRLPGIQTIETYWMDVLEAAMQTRTSTGWPPSTAATRSPPQGPALGVQSKHRHLGRPGRQEDQHPQVQRLRITQQLLPASKPDDMFVGLQNAFMSIAEGAGAAGSGLSSLQLSETSGGSNTYQGTYDAGTWSGDVIASRINKIVNDQPDLTQLWTPPPNWGTSGATTGSS
jgi:type IV pilus assembly protein PilY1